MAKSVVALIVSALLLSGCGPTELSPEQKQQVDALKLSLLNTEKDISQAKKEEHQYPGELMHRLVSGRLRILEENKSFLQQSINFIELAQQGEISAPDVINNEHMADSLSEKIANVEKEIALGREDAVQNSAGTVLNIRMSAIAWQEQALARLQQRYLAARFGQIQGSDMVADSEQYAMADVFSPAEGPFGFLPGLTRENIEDMIGKKLIPVQGHSELYRINVSPKASAEFDDFFLRISPKAGLCQINAIGKDISADSYGISLKGKFNEISNMLSAIYGKGEKTDALNPGSHWQAPQDWMASLYNKERVLRMEWYAPSSLMDQKELSGVDIEARTNQQSSGHITLRYTFRNNSQCASELHI